MSKIGSVHEGTRFKTAGYIGWLAVAAPACADIWAGRVVGVRAFVWGAAFVVFGVVYAAYLRPEASMQRRGRSAIVAMALLTTAGLTMVVTAVGLMKYLASVTLTIVAGELPYVFSRTVVWIWVAIQCTVVAALFGASFGWMSGVAGGAAYAGFQIFALERTWLEVRERRARRELAATNAELRATRDLLDESSRASERLRIARDLHDTLGHHLTALSVRLDVASRTVGDSAAAHVEEAYAITRLLLADVRAVVGELRQRDGSALAAALAALTNREGKPRVHVEVPNPLGVDSPAQANALFRCAQEVVTNAAKHSGATNVWIRLTHDSCGIHLEGRDDGAGTSSLAPGHGLNGMRERFAELGGQVEFVSAEGSGFTVRAFMPRAETVS